MAGRGRMTAVFQKYLWLLWGGWIREISTARRPGRRLAKGFRTRLEEGRGVGMREEGILESYLEMKK